MKLVELGKIARPHGLRGEARVRLHFARSETLLGASEVVLIHPELGETTRAVESARRANRAVLLKLRGVDDRNAAEALRDSVVAVPRDRLPALEDDEFYLCDLVGADVVTPDGPLGRVVEIRAHPSVDTLVIETSSGERREQPLCEPWVVRVDAATPRVELSGTDGLI